MASHTSSIPDVTERELMPSSHRKRIKHFHEPGDLHELTFSTYQRLPLLNPRRQAWLAESVTQSCRQNSCRLIAFVFMPEHVHLLVLPESGEPKAISRLLAGIKRPVSVRIKHDLSESNRGLLERLTITERPGKTVFRFWQEGPGYDRNLFDEQTVMTAIRYIHENPVRRGLVEDPHLWQWSSARWFRSNGELIDSSLPELSRLPPDFFVRDSRNRIRD